MKMKNYFRFVVFALLGLLSTQWASAQNVTVHPDNGSMLPALKSGDTDTFYGWGGFATWKHEQLSLTMTTGDSDNNTGVNSSGQLEFPANDIFESADGKTLQIGKGNDMRTYLTISLPKGYRFRGYSIKFHRISKPDKSSSAEAGESGELTFGETNNRFSYTYEEETYADGIWYSKTTGNWWDGYNTEYNTESYTIKRNSSSDTDMSNTLYFMLKSTSSSRCYISLDKIELLFTAEADYTPVAPSTSFVGRSAVEIPFTTSKMDYGTLTMRDDRGREPGDRWYDSSTARISYDGTLRDLNANLSLYEDGSVTEDDVNNGFDGTVGKMVVDNSGSISSAGSYFKLEASSHNHLTEVGDTAIYYIETPVWVTTKNGHKDPIGYRIVGARFDYNGDGAYIPATFKIQYIDEGVTYGLNEYNGRFSLNYQTNWSIDQEGFIYYGLSSSRKYLAVDEDGTSIIMVQEKPDANVGAFAIVENAGIKQICRKYHTDQFVGWQKKTIVSAEGTSEDVWEPVITESNKCFYTEVSAASHTGDIDEWTLLIYDETGTSVKEKRVVNNASYVEVDGYNNDAIKIGIIGTGYVNAHLNLQALDPYIDRLRIVCEEQGGNGGKVSQQFNATDFSVKGGVFTFYVPTSFTGDAKFTFEDLYSLYGDDTYYNETSSTNHARYFFVGSEYGDYDNSDVYARYNNIVHRKASYTTKIACLQPGDKKYKFNNAVEAAATSGSSYEEYPFSKALYKSKVDGSFTDFIFPNSSMNGSTTKTAYLFTCDETRYNIAPTTATQHVYYAFYEMKIKMRIKNYDPKLTWVPVYDATCYNNGTSTAVIDKPQYGLKLGTTVPSDEGDPNGYLTVSQVKTAIKAACKPKNTVGAPDSTEQILYIDGSELQSLVEDKQNNVEMTLDSLRVGLGANALVYLPKGTTSEHSNIAYMTPTGSFRGADDFELIDMRPFYAPYDIEIDQEKKITYKRSITVPKNGKVTSATIIMPFEISLKDAPFTLHKMQASNCLKGGEAGADPEAFFPNIGADQTDAQVTKAEANTPYLLKVTNPGTEKNYSFVLEQSGTIIKATTSMVKEGDYKYTFEGETGNGSANNTNYEFVHHGSFSGKQLEYLGNYFFFSKNMFLLSNDYVYKAPIKIAPFRTYYSSAIKGNGAKLAAFDIIFDEGMGNNTTGISSQVNNPDLMVVPGYGVITMTSTIEQNVRVHSTSGVLMNNAKLQAGETQTIHVPAGIYVINGVKIIVK